MNNYLKDTNGVPNETEQWASLRKYQCNLHALLCLEKKSLYNKEDKIAIANYNGKEIFITEFLGAKIQSKLTTHRGHQEIAENYIQLLPFIFSHHYDEIIEDTRNGRTIISVFDHEGRRIFHILDDDCLVSLFVMRKETFARSKHYKIKSVREGGVSSILSPAMPFWRHTDSIEELYRHFSKKYCDSQKL